MSASTSLITDSGTLISNGPTAATTTKAAGTADGLDYLGMLQEYKTKLYEVKNLLNQLVLATDSSDPNLTTINNDLLTLS